jgi:RNA 2',3'-cyclic 3'-phosphodiesterase
VRLFFAVELPEKVRAILGRLRTDESRAYRWVDADLLHLTLAFLGEQADERLPALERIGASAARSSRPGRLHLGEAGQFGSARAPRVLWVDVRGDVDRILALQRALAAELAREGFPTEERQFKPHITLARRRENASGAAPHGWPPTVEVASFELNELTLMQSRLSPRGPTYNPLGRFNMGG